MLPERDNLIALAEAYLMCLTDNNVDIIKKHLSLEFITRQRVSQQMRLIKNLPRFVYGIQMEVVLFDDYEIETKGNVTRISPFQFEVNYTPHTNLLDIERITMTIHSIILQNGKWYIESIVSPEEEKVLNNVIQKMEENG